MIDISSVVQDFVVEEQDGDFPAWWLACSNGHRFWASTQQIEAGPMICKECVTDKAVRTQAAQLAIDLRANMF
jgi:hypothetical protein